jgi:hypothetical protein
MNAPDRAEALVLGWARWYTRAADGDACERRLRELASDCFEQRRWGGEVGASPTAVATSMVTRTLAGIPADLLWRQAQIATSRDRSPNPRGRPMGPWMKHHWWLAIAGLVGAFEIVLGISLPFEDRTLGGLFGGMIIAALGAMMLGGIAVRRRRRRSGDLMVAAGTLPLYPFMWTVVLPVAGLLVAVPAMLDAADAVAAGPSAGPPEPRRGRDAPTTVLVTVLVAAVAAAIVVGEAATAVALVAPVLAALVAHLLLRGRLHAPMVARVGMTAFVTAILTGLVMMAVVLGSGGEIDLGESILPGLVSLVVGVLGLVGLAVFVAAGRGSRDRARPA